ncbi:MAG: hypothetical protein ACJARU_002441, partial [Congregibacter sp.]
AVFNSNLANTMQFFPERLATYMAVSALFLRA